MELNNDLKNPEGPSGAHFNLLEDDKRMHN